jgi:hypothetical protein
MDFLQPEFLDGFVPVQRTGCYFTNRYRHLHQLARPVPDDGVIYPDNHGFLGVPISVVIPRNSLLFRWEMEGNTGPHLWVYRTTVDIPAEQGIAAPLEHIPAQDPNGGEGGAPQWYIEREHLHTLERRRARHEEHHGIYDAR